MNNINFQQTGGFPLETDTLNFMQDAYKAMQSVTALGGENNYILSGVKPLGNSVTDGYAVIAGEVLPFRGGLLQDTVVILQDPQSRPFENGQVKEVYYSRYVTFGTGNNAIPFASLLRLKSLSDFRNLPSTATSAFNLDDANTLATARAVKLLNDKLDMLLSPGSIIIWSGAIADIPQGWALCDGQAGRPDLRDRFVYGAGRSYAVGQSGGAETHRLTVNEMPAHTHGTTITVGGTDFGKGSTRDSNTNAYGAQTGPTGGNLAHNNMPPYYVLAYIIKL